MTQEEEQYLYQLQGRIIAGEKLNEALLLALAFHQAKFSEMMGRAADPLAELDAFEKALVKGMQHTTFHDSEDHSEHDASGAQDTMWEACGQSIRLRFQNVREKLETL